MNLGSRDECEVRSDSIFHFTDLSANRLHFYGAKRIVHAFQREHATGLSLISLQYSPELGDESANGFLRIPHSSVSHGR